MNNETCKKKGLKCLIPFVAVFATIFIFDWLFHGIYMMPAYEATASLWRPQAEMQELMWVCWLSKAIMAGVITCLFCCMAKGAACGGKCNKTGAKFGLKIGLLLGAQQFASYIWLPIDMSMAINWFAGNVILGILIGVVLATLKRKFCTEGECKA